MQSSEFEHLTPMAAQKISEQLPELIRLAVIDRATELEYPVEAVVEM
jgi:hypothetical protein